MTANPSSTKVLVTGAGGFVGLHTILQLLRQGEQPSRPVRWIRGADKRSAVGAAGILYSQIAVLFFVDLLHWMTKLFVFCFCS
jgi:hypothetical protein